MPTARPATITSKQVAAFLKPRPKDSHKGLFGTVTVIGGAESMLGAALLAGRAALKMGAGCVHVGLLADKMPMVDMRVPELMLHPATDLLRSFPHPNPDGTTGGTTGETTSHLTKAASCQVIGYSHSTRLSKNASQVAGYPPKEEGANVKSSISPSVLVIGCGLGRSLSAQKLLYDALLLDVALVVDADALNLIAERPDLRSMLHGRKAPAVFTPHPGEAAHLLACSTEDIQKDRPGAVRELARRLNGSVVLKGAGSLCATQNGKLHINQTGNPGMSSAGMGDVLSGMIAAFIAQGMDPDEALLLAVHLHGAAGDELAKQQATLGMSATEVTEWARWLLNRMSPK